MSSLTDGTKFNANSTYFVSSTGSSVAGVLSLNGQSGTLNITSTDSSITATGSPGTVALSTTGNALAPSTVSATGAISGATTLNIAGATILSGATTLSGAVSCASTLATTGLASLNGGATISAPFNTPSFGYAVALSTAQTQSVTWDGQSTLILSLSASNQTVGGAVVNIGVPTDFNSNTRYAGRTIAKVFINCANASAVYTWNLVRNGITTQIYQHATGDGNAPNYLEIQATSQGFATFYNIGVAFGCAPITIG
jgi:hypothetical protein